MKEALLNKVDELRSDYTRVYGQPFSHFYCPILFKDEEVELCKAHIINQAFPDSSRAWTAQRKDLDGFYGSNFESDFIDITEFDNPSVTNIFTDKKLSKKFNAKIFVGEREVEHFFSPRGIPQNFPRLIFKGTESSTPLGLKIQPIDVATLENQKWEMEISRDIRISTMVSVIKAAHLTLFEMLGYNYVNRASAEFVGRQILGNFFLQNRGERKHEVLKSANEFFRPYIHMTRPILKTEFQGTITDKKLLMCMGSSGMPWATILFVKTADVINGVMIPTFGDGDQVATFFDFLKNDNSSIQVCPCQFAGDKWEIAQKTMSLIWPKANASFPPL